MKKISPYRILIYTIAFIFIAEFIIMAILMKIPCDSEIYHILIDSSVLSVITFIFIYFIIYKPLNSFFNEQKMRDDDLNKKISQSETKFKAVIERTPIPYALNDDQQNITYLNPAFIKTFGYELNDILTLEDWWPKAYPDTKYRLWVAEEWSKRIDISKKTGSTFNAMELKIRCNDNSYKTALVGAAPLTENFSDEHLVYLFDITKRKQAEEMQKELINQVKEANSKAMFMLAVASEYKDHETGEHIHRIQSLVTRLALIMGLNHHLAKRMGIDSILHDLGKIALPDEILTKPGKLTEDEFEAVKLHTFKGAEIIGDNEWFKQAREIALYHHEKWDGSGYPEGLKGEEIPLSARIVAIADVFDALTSKRPYKEPWTLSETVDEIREQSGKHFDPNIVEAFIELHKRGKLFKNEIVSNVVIKK